MNDTVIEVIDFILLATLVYLGVLYFPVTTTIIILANFFVSVAKEKKEKEAKEKEPTKPVVGYLAA